MDWPSHQHQQPLLSLWLPIFSYLRSRANARADDEREKEKRRFKVSERAWLLASVPCVLYRHGFLGFPDFDTSDDARRAAKSISLSTAATPKIKQEKTRAVIYNNNTLISSDSRNQIFFGLHQHINNLLLYTKLSLIILSAVYSIPHHFLSRVW
jgi:hypothetical protein